MALTELIPENFTKLYWLRKHIQYHNGFIAGGCFKNILAGETVKDIDIFFRSQQDFDQAAGMMERITNPDGSKAYTQHYRNKKVAAFKETKTGITLELCNNIFGSPSEVIQQFDFTITKFAMSKEAAGTTLDGQEEYDYPLICDDKYFEHLYLKRLVLDDLIPYPMSTYERMIRYIGYGYKPCKETKIKLVKALRDIPDKDVDNISGLYDGLD